MYHYNIEDRLMDYESSFLIGLENLYPKIPMDKSIIMHKPFILGFLVTVN